MGVLGRPLQSLFTGVLGPVLRRIDDQRGRERMTARVDALLHRFRGRLSDKDYQGALENSGHAEWELAVITIREAVSRKELTLREVEARALAQIESQLRYKW